MSTTTLLLIFGGLGLLLIMGAGVALLVGGSNRVNVDERLDQFVGISPEWKEIAEEQNLLRQEDVADRLDKAISGRGFNFVTKIKETLATADIKLRVTEYLALLVISAIGLAVVCYFLIGGITGAIIGGVLGSQIPRWYVKYAATKRMRAFDYQLSDTLNLWVNALRSGFSVLQGMEAIATELPPPVSKEFERILQEIRLGIDMEEALAHSLSRVPSEDYDLVVTAINIQREVGGNLAEILDIISFTVRERVRIKGEIRTLTAQGRASGWVITILPMFLAGALYFINRSYIMELFARQEPFILSIPCGWLLVGTALIMIAAGGYAIQRIVDIEV